MFDYHLLRGFGTDLGESYTNGKQKSRKSTSWFPRYAHSNGYGNQIQIEALLSFVTSFVTSSRARGQSMITKDGVALLSMPNF